MPGNLDSLFSDKDLQFLFVGGKGGVGKTTCSSSLAIQFAQFRSSSKVLLISTDPAHNLSDAFRQQFSGVPELVNGTENLWAMETDPKAVMESDVDDIIKGFTAGDTNDETASMINDFRQWLTSVPGIDEAMALSAVLRHVESGEFSLIVFDTAPTGHTLRLLQLPMVLKTGLEKLRSWRTKMASMFLSVSSFLSPNSDASAKQEALTKLEKKLDTYQKDVAKITKLFKDQQRTQFVCVCIAEHLSVFETRRLCSELSQAHIACKHILVNQLVPRTLVNVTPETGGANAIREALEAIGAPAIAVAVQEACELCGARARIQKHYLKVLQDGVEGQQDLTLLPLLPAEVRGVENLLSFSQRLLKVDPKLVEKSDDNNVENLEKNNKSDSSSSSSPFNELQQLKEGTYRALTNAKVFDGSSNDKEDKTEDVIELSEEKAGQDTNCENFEKGDTIELHSLSKAEFNGLQGILRSFDTESGRWKVSLKKRKKPLAIKEKNLRIVKKRAVAEKEEKDGLASAFPNVPLKSGTGGGGLEIPESVTPEMMSLVQKTLMQPGGFQKLMEHKYVVELEKDAQMKTFFNDFKTKGVFGCFHYLSNNYVMSRLAAVAKAIQEEEN